MIAELKVASAAGIAALLAMCATMGTVHQTTIHRHTKHKKVVHDHYIPSPTPRPTEIVIISPPVPPPIKTEVKIPAPTATPWYRTTAHKNPPWSVNFKPDN